MKETRSVDQKRAIPGFLTRFERISSELRQCKGCKHPLTPFRVWWPVLAPWVARGGHCPFEQEAPTCPPGRTHRLHPQKSGLGLGVTPITDYGWIVGYFQLCARNRQLAIRSTPAQILPPGEPSRGMERGNMEATTTACHKARNQAALCGRRDLAA